MTGIQLGIVGVRFPPETFIERRLSRLVERGFEITVFGYPQGHWEPPEGVTAVALSSRGQSKPRRALDLGRSMLSAGTAPLPTVDLWKQTHSDSLLDRALTLRSQLPVARSRVDVLHFEWNSVAVQFLPLWEEAGPPVVISARGRQIQILPHVPGNEAYTEGVGRSFAAAAAVHCVSEAIRSEVIALGAVPERTHVIRPSVDPDFFRPRPRGRSSGPLRIVSTGTLMWRKGFEYLLSAIALLEEANLPAFRLEIIGEGPDRQRLEYAIDDLGLADRVELHGRCTPDQVLSILQEADVFCLPSLSEGISNAVIEAMSCGLPIVTTDCGGMREIVDDGVEGLVVETRDAPALADALARVLKDETLRYEMGDAGRARVVHELNLDKQADAFAKLYNEVLI